MRIFLLIFIFLNLHSQELQKPKIYDKSKHNISNWYMSEKLDGIRAYWNGKELLSKNGNKIYTPNWFTKDFPPFELD
jgi:DNA ligase-1